MGVNNNVGQPGGGGGVPEAPIDGKIYGRKDASWAEVITSGYPFTVGAASTGATYTTIQAAITAAELVGGPIVIFIYAGLYTEALTISKPGINLTGFTGRSEGQTELTGDITISVDAATQMTLQGLFHKGRLFVTGANSTILYTNNYEVKGAHATEGVVHMTNTHGSTTFIPSPTCRITNTAAGPAIASTAGARVDAEGARILASSYDRAIDSNGDIILNNCTCQGAVKYTGNGAFKVLIVGGSTDITSSGFCVDLGSAGGAASALVINAYLVNLLNTKVLNGSGTNITYAGITIPDGFGTLNSTHGVQIRHDGVKVLNDTGALTGILGNLGDYENAAAINAFLGIADMLALFAEVNARTQANMIALTNTNGTTGTWADITAALLDGGAGAQTMFPGLGVNNAFYIGADQLPNAIGYILSTAITLGAGAVSVEYWNGAWTSLKLMESAALDHTSNINNILQNTGTFHLRHNEPTDSALLSLDGNNKHWIRIIIGTAAITTSPILDNANWFKDGRHNTELFGSFQRVAIINVYEFQDVITRLVGNTDVPAGVNTGINKQNNQLQNNAYDSFGVIVRTPEDINTAIDIVTVLSYIPESTNVNNWEGRMALAKVKDGDVADGTLPEQTVSTIIALDGTLDLVKRYQEAFDVEDLNIGDDLQIAVGRDATGGNLNDLFTGGIAARVLSIAYKRWK